MNKTWILFLPLVSLLACSGGGEKRPLVSAKDIHRWQNAGKDLQIIDVRTEDEFDAGHMPGAIRIYRNQIEDESHMLEGMRIPKSKLEQLLGSKGISENDSIFLYDSKGNVDASRLWWLLRYYGFEKVALIDGGYIQWRMLQFPVEVQQTKRESVKFSFAPLANESLLAEKSDLVDKNYVQLIDARSEEEFTGVVMKNGAIRAGHIPGAVQINYIDFISGGNFTIRPKEEIARVLEFKGISTDEKTITYCHSGVRSAFETFVLIEIMEMEDVSNYDGSWVEWSADEELPVEL